VSAASDDTDFRLLGDLLRQAGIAPVPAASGDPATAAPAVDTTAAAPAASGAPASPAAPAVPSAADAAGRERSAVARRSRVSGLARRVAQVWHAAVGDEIAANALPRQLRNGRLVVAASSPAWAQSLQFMAEDIRGRLNHLLGEEAVMTVFFRHAGWEAAPQPPSVPSVPGITAAEDARVGRDRAGASLDEGPPLDAEQQAALQSLDTLGLNPELAGSIARAMKAAFARGVRGRGGAGNAVDEAVRDGK